MKELQKENLLTVIIKSIASYISENQLNPGDKLPTEVEISKKLNVARSSVRESLKALQAIGILESKPGVGTIISTKGLDPFVLSLILGTLIGTTTFRELGEIRIIMEQGAIPLIIRRSSKKELNNLMVMAKELDTLKEQSYSTPKVTDNTIAANKEVLFHQEILRLSKNPILEKFGFLLRLFFFNVSKSGDLLIQTQRYSIPKTERVMHAQVVQAMMDKNISKAEEAIRLHLRYWAECKDELDPVFIYKIILPDLVESAGVN